MISVGKGFSLCGKGKIAEENEFPRFVYLGAREILLQLSC